MTESLGRRTAAIQVIRGEDLRRRGVTTLAEALRGKHSEIERGYHASVTWHF
jgi:hypothetical protein